MLKVLEFQTLVFSGQLENTFTAKNQVVTYGVVLQGDVLIGMLIFEYYFVTLDYTTHYTISLQNYLRRSVDGEVSCPCTSDLLLEDKVATGQLHSP